MIGKFAVTVVFTFDYFWSSEVFPTTLRSTLVGICSLWARIGMILSPIIVDLVWQYIYYNMLYFIRWILVYPCVYIGSLYGFLIGKEYLLEIFRGLDVCMLYTQIRRNCKENHRFVKIISIFFYFVFK